MNTPKKRKPKLRQPKYRRQPRPQSRDVAFVVLNRRRIYLGEWDAPDSRRAYHRVLAEWEASGRKPPPVTTMSSLETPPADIMVIEVAAAYWQHTKGNPSASVRSLVKKALEPLQATFGVLPASRFGPNALRRVRETWVAQKLAHKTIGHHTAAVKRMFQWAAGRELIPVSVCDALRRLEPLSRRDARQTAPVGPAPIEHVEAVKAHVSRQVAALIDLQLLTGARPGELCALRPIDIDTTTGNVWEHRPTSHKNAHRGKPRVIYFGPEAQKVIRPYLARRPTHGPLFSPREAMADRAVGAPTHRREGQAPTPRKSDRALGDRYTTGSYRRAIAEACKVAGVPTWHPHQLRHSAATYLRKHFGLEAASIILGHSSALVTEAVYAERDATKAREIVERVG